jgi:hypothetical protein
MIRVLLSMGQYGEAQSFVVKYKGKVSKDLVRRVEKSAEKKDIVKLTSEILETDEEDDNSETFSTIPIGAVKQQFSSEKILEDELICRIERDGNMFGMTLSVYEAAGAYGRQFIIPIGRLDILAIDKQNNLYVIELKKDSGYDDPFDQTVKYVEWLEKNMSEEGRKVYGIICLNNPTQRVIERIRSDNRIQLFEYCISYNKIE